MKKYLLITLVCLIMVGISLPIGADYDFGGEEVTIICWPPLIKEGQEERIEAAEEKFNVKIKLKEQFGWGERTERIYDRIISGEAKNDIIRLNAEFFMDLVGEEIFYPVGEILGDDYYETLPRIDREVARKAYTYDGKIYGLGTREPWTVNFVVSVYNKDIIEKADLTDPYELWKEGKWTWDAVNKIAEETTKDLDGDGTIDQWGLTGIQSHDYIYGACKYFGFANNSRFVKINENNKVIYNMDDPAVMKSVEQLLEWVQSDMIVEEMQLRRFHEGDIAIAEGVTLPRVERNLDKMDFEFGIVPPPRGPDANKCSAILPWGASFVLPINSNHPEGKAELLQFLFPEEEYEEKQENAIKRIAQTKEQAEVIQWLNKNYDGDVEPYFGGGRIRRELRDVALEIFNGEKTISSAFDELKPRMQNILDERLSQCFIYLKFNKNIYDLIIK